MNKESVLGIQLCDLSPKKRIPRNNIMDNMSFLIAQQLFADGHHMSLLKGSRLCQNEIGEFSSQKFNLLTRKGIVIS